MSDGRHVVIDARMALDGGIGTYLQQLVPRVVRARAQWRFTAIGRVPQLRTLHWQDIPGMRLVEWSPRIFSVAEQVSAPWRVSRDADVFWAPNYNVPMLASGRLVTTVHDVNHLALPELMGDPVRRMYARGMMRLALRRSREILFVSRFTRDEARRLLGAYADRGVVVHSGVDEAWTRVRQGAPHPPLPGPYFVYVGNIKRHKNVPFLLRAFARTRDRLPHRLILIGRTTGLRADPSVREELEHLGDRVEMLGETSQSVVMHHVAHATALVTASLYEGFGLPPLEAMAAGTPCVVSRAGSLPEVCGDAAHYGDPHNEADFAARLIEVATQPVLRESLIARGRARAEQFSWDRAAEATAATIGRALAP